MADRLADLRRRLFDPHLALGRASGGLAADPGGALHSIMQTCLQEAPLGDCLAAGRPVLEAIHEAQGRAIYGLGTCPEGAFVAWLDRMAPVPAFPLCVRMSGNQVDGEIKMRGGWKTCQQLARLLAEGGLGTPGCHVLDIGANIGACTVALARLGYHVTAFEPQPQNSALLEASLRLNGFLAGSTATSAPPRGDAAATAAAAAPAPPPASKAADTVRGKGSVSLVRKALGMKVSESWVLEGRRNAGMSIVQHTRPGAECDNDMFYCSRAAPVRVARLDDVLGPEAEPVCLAKMDVEGLELQVIRGALETLRSRTIRALHLEWWPPHLTAQREEPVELLWLLHALKFEIFAPARWFDKNKTSDKRLVMVVPEQFPWLLMHWGDIVARAAAW